jgi:C-terminal processing protease CtpA/Prc
MGAVYPEVENPLPPFEFIVFDNRLYVKTNLSADTSLKKGTEILKIHGKPVRDILSEMIPYLPGERLENKIRKLRNEAFPNWYRLVYGNFESFEIDYTGPDGIETRRVKGAHWNQFPKYETEMLSLTFPEKEIACLKVSRFRRPGEFLPFIDSAFTEIKNRQVDHLIIDITEGGGFTDLADSLFSYITRKSYCILEKKMIRISRETKEFIDELKEEGERKGEYFILSRKVRTPLARSNRFKGQVYVLTGPRTYSASSMFAAMAKCYSDAIIVGEETGMPSISNADLSRYKLPHSGMNIYTSLSIYYLPCAENDKDGVKPDVEVKMSTDDLLEGRNRYLEYTIDLIRHETDQLKLQ